MAKILNEALLFKLSPSVRPDPLALADRDRREELREQQSLTPYGSILRRSAAGHVGARSAATQRSGSLKRDDQARFEATAERAVSHRRDISLAS